MAGADVYRDVTADAMAAPAAEAGVSDAVGEARTLRMAALFDVHYQRLYRLARWMSGGRDAARDLVQETFLRAARAVDSVPSGESAEASWLVRVLVNICRDEWRRLARSRRWQGSAPPTGESPHPEAAFIAHTTIWRAMWRLAPRRRAVLVMYELEGVGIPEIARLLGISAVTVRWHLSRGRRELAAAVRALDGAPESAT